MGNVKFMSKDAFDFGWKKMKENFWFLAGILFITVVVGGLQNYFSSLDMKTQLIANFLGSFIFWAIGVILYMGILQVTLDIHDKGSSALGRFFSARKLFFKYIFSAFLYSLIVFAGFILLIVPGIMWAVRFQFFAYFIVDKNVGPVEALKLSSKATEGVRMDIFWFDVATIGAIILGVLALFVGLLVAIPTVMMATVYVYRKLEPKVT